MRYPTSEGEIMTNRCPTCTGPAVEDSAEGCTPYTCRTRCITCGHVGDVHRDWYDPGFCRRCPERAEHRHDFQAATAPAATI